MATILFATVGGSAPPVIKSLESFRPQLTYFIVSDNTDMTKGSIDVVVGDYYIDFKGNKCETITKNLGLTEEQYKLIIVDPDNPFDVYEKVAPYVEEHIKKEDRINIDCTGGTKSMSVGLGYVNLEYPETHLCIITGPRLDLVKVISGERVKKFNQNKVYYERQIKSSETLIADRDYNAAYRVLEKLSIEMSIEDDSTFNRLYYLSQGFDAWDKFQYEKALFYIERFKDDELIKPYNAMLKQLINIEKLAKNFTPETKIPTHNGYILVYDLVYNAERKASANYFDDAVSRLYRALEMYEQFAHFTNEPRINTGDLDVNVLPEHIREAYKDTKEIGLHRSYDLLESLGHPIGQVWAKYKFKVLDTLKFRNYSYFAHGFNPVTKENFEAMRNVVWDFISECDVAMGFRTTVKDYLQLPNKF